MVSRSITTRPTVARRSSQCFVSLISRYLLKMEHIFLKASTHFCFTLTVFIDFVSFILSSLRDLWHLRQVRIIIEYTFMAYLLHHLSWFDYQIFGIDIDQHIALLRLLEHYSWAYYRRHNITGLASACDSHYRPLFSASSLQKLDDIAFMQCIAMIWFIFAF